MRTRPTRPTRKTDLANCSSGGARWAPPDDAQRRPSTSGRSSASGDYPELLQIRGEWRQAAERWAGLGCPYHRALALTESGDAEATLAALAALDDLGATATAAVVRKELRRLGMSSVPGGPQRGTRSNPAGLTDRQLKVLTLLADGQTNNEIAAVLVLSVRTVEHHVAAVLAKLDVPSRQDAVTVARNTGITEAPDSSGKGRLT